VGLQIIKEYAPVISQMRSNHLAMLHKNYSTMNDEVWDTHATEHRNAECKQKQPISLKMAMINIYNLDK